MSHRFAGRRFGLPALALAATLATLATNPAHADQIAITYSAAGQVAPNFTSICAYASACDYGLENFSSPGTLATLSSSNTSFKSSFNDAGTGSYSQPSGVSFTGTYSVGPNTWAGSGGQWQSHSQNQYGGVAGHNYPELFGPGGGGVTSYSLALASTGVPGVNYFGVWISALDPFNDMKVYDGSTLVAEFTSPSLISDLGNCSNPSANAYCGNPTAQFKGQDSGELFAYVNVFDLSGYITNVVFSDSGATGFESTNDAVGYVNPINVSGTAVNAQVAVPEPAGLTLLGIAVAGLLGLRRRLRR